MPTPSQLAALTPAGQDALNRLKAFRAAQASVPPAPGSPLFAGPPRPPIPPSPGILNRAAGATANAAKATAGVIGRGLASAVPTAGAGAAGVGMMLYPSKLGDGTLSSPEAQEAIAENEKIRRSSGNPLVASEPSGGFVNSLIKPSVPTQEVANQQKTPDNTITTPQGVANIRRGTGVVEAPITNPQEAERSRIAGIKGRISTENPYGADVVNGGVRTGQIRVGATTDVEAARNLQDRALQDIATANRVAEINRATDALKDLRAARQGISRSELDLGSSTPLLVVGEAGGGFGSDILARDRFLRQFQPSPGKKGNAKAEANMVAAQEVWNQNQQAKQKPTILPQAQAVDPLDMGRFLLDQQKFGWQQGIDKGRLVMDMAKVEDSQSGTALEKQKYADERRKAFMDTFSYPDKKAPQEQLGALVLSLSDATKGQVPPELMTGYIQKAAEEAGVDWENAPPKSLTALGKRAMELAALDNR